MRNGIASVALAALVGLAPTTILANPFTDLATLANAIKGTMKIVFDTRTQPDTTGRAAEGSPALGALDTYTLDLEVANSVLFRGTITRQPWIPSPILGRTIQDGVFDYDIRAMLRNPSKPDQTVTLGGLVGAATLDGGGKYSLAQPPEGKGPMRLAIDSIGAITGFTSPFGGEIQGRVPEQAGLMGLADRAAKQVDKTYTRVVDGKAVQHVVEGADPMDFLSVSLAQGPLAAYPESKLNGSIDYDAEEGIWYVDVNASYSVEGQTQRDRYSGTIRWNEDPSRATNGLGFYEVNVRLNEKATTEADTFAASADAEAAFFATDVSVPGFTGKVSYVDTFDDETVVASVVTYAVDGNSASKIQTMNFAKILLLMIGPFNDE